MKIDLPTSLGSGFFFREDGWILTNHHVIATCPVDNRTGVPMCRIIMGTMNADGSVVPRKSPAWARVYKADARADLALLKVDELPDGLVRAPYLKISEQPGRLGQDCFLIGMPKLGFQWSVRDGIVSSHGRYPDDATLGEGLLRATDAVEQAEDRVGAVDGGSKCTISTCLTNPGDSGSAVFDKDGKVIAIHFAAPQNDPATGKSLSKFGYHVHLDEVREFIREIPSEPILTPPTFKLASAQLGTFANGEAKFRGFTLEIGDATSVLYDLHSGEETHSGKKMKKLLDGPEKEFVEELGIDWGISKVGDLFTYYFDLDRSGDFELVVVSPIDDGDVAKRYMMKDGKWLYDTVPHDFLDRIQFESSESQNKFQAIRNNLPPKMRR